MSSLEGVLVADKPAGPTSHDIVADLRRFTGRLRVGHTGTLDPFATGVLPLCIGRATRLSRYLSSGRKIYSGVIHLGVSTDTHYVHLAWRKAHPDLRALPFPMLADTKRELSQALGVLHPAEGVAIRATFIVDPNGVIRHASANDLSVGRNVDEILRTLDALQTGALTPCNWKKGDPTLRAA